MPTKQFITGVTALAALLSAATSFAHTGNLRGAFAVQSTSVLPKGRFKTGVISIFSETDERFNGGGQSEALSQPLQQVATLQSMSGLLSQVERAEIGAVLSQVNAAARASGSSQLISETTALGATDGDISVGASVYVPQLNYGLTKNLSIGFVVPVYQLDVNTSVGFSTTAEGQKVLQAIRSASPAKAAELAERMNNAVNTMVESMGYDPIQSSTSTHLGDISLGAKYLALTTDRNRIAIRPKVTMPTGTADDPDNLVDCPTGDGQWDVSTTAVWDHSLTKDLVVTTHVGYTVQLPNKAEKRIPVSSASILTSDKEVVDQNLGDVTDAGTFVGYQLTSFLNLGAGYQFQHMNQASYDGTKFSSARYRLLEGEMPAQTLHSATASLEFSTISMYRRNQFFAPMKAVLVYSRPLSGKNVPSSDVITAEVVAYF